MGSRTVSIGRPRECVLGGLLYRAYAIGNWRVGSVVRSLCAKLEGGEFTSITLRRIMADYHLVRIGMYTHGGCFVPFQFDKHTTIGNYCSVARGSRVMNRNHPTNHKSMHALFFNPRLGFCPENTIPWEPLEVGHDVWIGHNAIIMPQVHAIGTGAVVAAGAVVNKDVPPYAVVVGNPARVVRFRFSPDTIAKLLASRWWEKTLDELSLSMAEFTGQYEQTPEEAKDAVT